MNNPAGLTPREMQVCEGVANGQSYKEIGRALGISHRTVELYVHKITFKISALEGRSKRSLPLYWMRCHQGELLEALEAAADALEVAATTDRELAALRRARQALAHYTAASSSAKP